MTERNGITIIDLQQSVRLHQQRVRVRSARPSFTAWDVLFVGTKRAQEPTERPRRYCPANNRWLGGITNFNAPSVRCRTAEGTRADPTSARWPGPATRRAAPSSSAKRRRRRSTACRDVECPRRSGSSTPSRSTSRSVVGLASSGCRSSRSSTQLRPDEVDYKIPAMTTPSAASPCSPA